MSSVCLSKLSVPKLASLYGFEVTSYTAELQLGPGKGKGTSD